MDYRIRDYLNKGSTAGLLIMLFAIPAIPCILVWNFIAPSTVWQMIAMLVISAILYIFFGIAELIILAAIE